MEDVGQARVSTARRKKVVGTADVGRRRDARGRDWDTLCVGGWKMVGNGGLSLSRGGNGGKGGLWKMKMDGRAGA